MNRIRPRTHTPPAAAETHNALPLLLDEVSAARHIGVSIPSLRKGRCHGVLRGRTQMPPFVRIGGRVYYRLTDLNAWASALVGYNTLCEEAALNERDTLAQEAN